MNKAIYKERLYSVIITYNNKNILHIVIKKCSIYLY